jgi:hypothetical protein
VCDCSLNNRPSNAQAQYYVVSGLSVCAIFLQLFHQDHNFLKDVNKHKVFDSMISKTCHKNFKLKEELWKILSQTYTCDHVMYRLFLSDFIEYYIFSTENWKLGRFQTKVPHILFLFQNTNWGKVNRCVISNSITVTFSCGTTDCIKRIYSVVRNN